MAVTIVVVTNAVQDTLLVKFRHFNLLARLPSPPLLLLRIAHDNVNQRQLPILFAILAKLFEILSIQILGISGISNHFGIGVTFTYEDLNSSKHRT